MTRALLAAALAALPLMAPAQDAVPFPQRILDAATPAEAARFPVTCAGLFRALARITDEGETKDSFRNLETESALIGIMALAAARDLEDEEAIRQADGYIGQISAIYIDWFTRNLQTEGGPLDDAIRAHFAGCREELQVWQGMLDE